MLHHIALFRAACSVMEGFIGFPEAIILVLVQESFYEHGLDSRGHELIALPTRVQAIPTQELGTSLPLNIEQGGTHVDELHLGLRLHKLLDQSVRALPHRSGSSMVVQAAQSLAILHALTTIGPAPTIAPKRDDSGGKLAPRGLPYQNTSAVRLSVSVAHPLDSCACAQTLDNIIWAGSKKENPKNDSSHLSCLAKELGSHTPPALRLQSNRKSSSIPATVTCPCIPSLLPVPTLTVGPRLTRAAVDRRRSRLSDVRSMERQLARGTPRAVPPTSHASHLGSPLALADAEDLP